VISTKEGNVDAVDAFGGEFFNGGVSIFGDLLTVEKRRKRKGIVMCVRESSERGKSSVEN
jgi:hypothetical protein